MRTLVLVTFLSAAVAAGCLDDEPATTTATPAVDPSDLPGLLAAANRTDDRMQFEQRVVTAASTFANDLYEPTLEVSSTGAVYITGHTIAVDTTGAPVFVSKDDGLTWAQLPFFGSTTMPGNLHGATPPPSDEIFLVAGDDGWLYGVDITLATFPVNAWSGDGAELSYHNPNAYDEFQSALQAADCTATPAKDRPWAAYANGTLLMVSNPAAGPAQVGVLPVPPGPLGLGAAPAPLGLGATSGGGKWNMCAGPGYKSTDCSIPGIPDIRGDGTFVVPQRCGGRVFLTVGNAVDVMDVDLVPVLPTTTGGEITSVYGIAAFDGNGDLFVGITNNTTPDKADNRTGNLRIALSLDGGRTFAERTFTTGYAAPIVHFYMDANDFGPGALAVWATPGSGRNAEGEVSAWDWYAGHVQAGADGLPTMENVYLALDEGPMPSAHVTGAGVGPDGRAYLAMFEGTEFGGTPLSVLVQTAGPRLPVFATE